ncbi:MAG: S26 family signal peptidase [Candidatus Methylomirabilales bacterium]
MTTWDPDIPVSFPQAWGPAPDDRDPRLAAGAALLRDWMAAGGLAWLPLHGDSMRPFLPAGSRVRIGRVAPGEVRLGDLVVYATEERLVCHRVLRRRARGNGHALLTKGDGRRSFEAWVDAAQVLGRVVEVERRGRVLRLRRPGRRLHALAAAAASLGWVALRAVLSRGRAAAEIPAA